jgi:hypothetical protein
MRIGGLVEEVKEVGRVEWSSEVRGGGFEIAWWAWNEE